MSWLEGYNYLVYALLVALGLYAIIGRRHLVKKVMGLGVLQTGAFLFFISLAYVRGGTAPIIREPGTLHVNPLPHVLILTAIVVGVSTMAVALALCVRIKEEWGTCESDELDERGAP
jgi:multicomponent Na+:H+ antiporter subunit C